MEVLLLYRTYEQKTDGQARENSTEFRSVRY